MSLPKKYVESVLPLELPSGPDDGHTFIARDSALVTVMFDGGMWFAKWTDLQGPAQGITSPTYVFDKNIWLYRDDGRVKAPFQSFN